MKRSQYIFEKVFSILNRRRSVCNNFDFEFIPAESNLSNLVEDEYLFEIVPTSLFFIFNLLFDPA
jgi:hypothetical protein